MLPERRERREEEGGGGGQKHGSALAHTAVNHSRRSVRANHMRASGNRTPPPPPLPLPFAMYNLARNRLWKLHNLPHSRKPDVNHVLFFIFLLPASVLILLKALSSKNKEDNVKISLQRMHVNT